LRKVLRCGKKLFYIFLGTWLYSYF
jgi:hypothetical protein